MIQVKIDAGFKRNIPLICKECLLSMSTADFYCLIAEWRQKSTGHHPKVNGHLNLLKIILNQSITIV